MLKSRRRLSVVLAGSLLLAAAGTSALAQTTNAQAPATVGPPQLRDFQLKGERRSPPAQPQQTAPATPAPRQPAQSDRRTPPAAPPAERPRPTEAPVTQPARQGVPEATRQPTQATPQPAPAPQAQDIFQPPAAAPAPAQPLPAGPAQTAPAPVPDEGTSFWLYLIPMALLGLGAAVLRRRRRRAAEAAAPALAAAAALDAAPLRPRAEPVPRAWLEIELKAERASTADEASVEFEMIIRNTGKSVARNIQINARMFNAGAEQDKEIGAFFKSKGEGRRTYTFPELPPGEEALVQGTVTMPREEMRALRVREQLLFIPVVGVNAVYEWGEGRTGQTSKSYVIGRELGQETGKMGAFRVDLGPRVYRTVGQRQHNLAKRV